jgi:hypothetical protein
MRKLIRKMRQIQAPCRRPAFGPPVAQPLGH